MRDSHGPLSAVLNQISDSRHYRPLDPNSGRTRSYKIFLGATDEEWQTAFAGANGELAQGDWSHRLSEIQQEYCGNSEQGRSQEGWCHGMAMAKRLALERGNVLASFRNDPESISDIKHCRVQAMKEIVFQARIDQSESIVTFPLGQPGERKSDDWASVPVVSAQRSCCNIDIALTIPSRAASGQRGLGRTLTHKLFSGRDRQTRKRRHHGRIVRGSLRHAQT